MIVTINYLMQFRTIPFRGIHLSAVTSTGCGLAMDELTR